jgi:8-amino-7-oxononanoate synthase
MTFEEDLERELAELKDHDRLRDSRPFGGLDRARPRVDGARQVLAFCSNDYLGLASHPALVAAARQAMTESGLGAGASRLVSGESPWHRNLERSLAELVGQPAALLFPTGYQANVGVITAIAAPGDLIVSDAANHASLIDGCRLSRARISVYPHCDASAASRALAAGGEPFRRRLLVTESLFSMDGDRAPLQDLAAVATEQGAVLVVDEAHALGVLGPGGRGLCFEAGVVPQILVGTLGKALGTAGGFVAGTIALRAVLLNRARTFIYTTAPPPPLAAAAAAAVALASGRDGDDLRARAAANAARLRRALTTGGLPILDRARDLIVPLIVGRERQALAAAGALLDRGILVPAIRPPTVPVGSARLRITVSASHSPDDVDALAAALLELRSLLSGASG